MIGNNHGTMIGFIKKIKFLGQGEKKIGILTVMYGKPRESNNSEVDFVNAAEVRVPSFKMSTYGTKLEEMKKIIEDENANKHVKVIVDYKAQGKAKDVAGESVLYVDPVAEKLQFEVLNDDRSLGYNHLSLTGEIKHVDIRWGKDKKTGSAILTFMYGPQKDKSALQKRETTVNAIYIRIPTYRFEAYRNKLLALEQQLKDSPDVVVRAVADAHVQGVLKRVVSTGSLVTEIIADRVIFEWDLDAEAEAKGDTPSEE